MADVLHRTADIFLRSVNDPDYPAADWIVNPVVNGQPFRSAGMPVFYALRAAHPDDTVTEMDAAQKQAVDDARAAAELEAQRTGEKGQIDDLRIWRAYSEVLLVELNRHATRFNTLRAAIASAANLAEVKASAAAIQGIPERTLNDLVTAVKNTIDGL